MQITARLGREYITQIISFVVSLMDRIVIAGVLLRIWGIDDFAAWSIAASAAGFVTMFDMGVNLYFGNRLLFLIQQGKVGSAAIVLRAGNFWMGFASLTGLTVVMTVFWFFGPQLTVAFSNAVWLAALLLSVAAAIRMALSVHMSLYRAHAQYARQTMLFAALDTVRILSTIAVVFAGGGFLVVGGVQLVVTLGAAFWILFVDAPRRFTDYPFGLGQLPQEDRRQAFSISAGYWMQSGPATALTFLPVFLMTALGAGSLAIAQFVLMRTAANFVRAGLQMFAIVLGQESARRLAIDDRDGLQATYHDAAIFLGVQTACAAGVLLAIGRPLFTVWTAKGELYDPYLLWLAILPPLVMPSTTLALNVLATANLPWSIALGRTVQMVLTVILFLVLPIEGQALKIMTAVAIGELLGFGLPTSLAAYRLIPGTGPAFHLRLLWRSALCCGACFLVTGGAVLLVGGHDIAKLLVGLIAGGIAAAIAVVIAGISKLRRDAVFAALQNKARRWRASLGG
ncbi:MAG: hypothetical protein ABI240_10535 [Sphingomonas sp.]